MILICQTKKYFHYEFSNPETIPPFDDVDLADWPVLIRDPKLKWTDVKKRIEKEVMDCAHQEKSIPPAKKTLLPAEA